MATRVCGECGKENPEGEACVTLEGVTIWYCHGDDDPDPTCYMKASRMPPDWVTEEVLL